MAKKITSPVPEPHAGYARQVCDLITNTDTSLRDQLTSLAGLTASYATRLIEDPSIICISGERGSGKTTVLATAAADLAVNGHIVIPPIRPEYFSRLGSLLPTAVAHLQTTVTKDWPFDKPSNEDVSIKVEAAIERTLRQANLIFFEGSDASPLRADEQAADRSLAASADSNFLDNWQKLTAQVRDMRPKASRPSADPLIVIPVDDPDLAPGALRQILLDLRLLTSVDGVVGITCLDLDEARAVLFDAYTSSYRTPPSPQLASRVVEAQIAKAFPDDYRVTIGGLDSEHKLAFKALDLPLPGLEELCESYPIGGRFADDTVASVLRLPGSGKPSLYADALPANPRDLRGLAYRLSVAASSSFPAGEAAIELCRLAIANGLKLSGATDPELWSAGLPFEVLPPVDGQPACVLRLDNIRVSGVADRQRTIPEDKHDDGTTIIKIGHDSAIETTLVTAGERQTIRRLDPSFSAAILLVREYEHYYGVIRCSVSGNVPYRGGERASRYLEVAMDGSATDDRFLNVPPWEAYYDYFVFDEAIDELVSVATTSHALPDRRLAIEAYFIDFCRNVVAVQLRRETAKEPVRVSKRVRRGGIEAASRTIDRELTRLFEEIEECLRVEDGRSPSDDVRAKDFQYWVEVRMMNICHDRLVRQEFIDRLALHRTQLLESRKRLAVANGELAALLESRVKAALDEKWVISLILLTQRLDEERGAILLAAHSAALEAIERGRHRLLGKSALGAPVGQALHLPAYEQNADFDVALEVLDKLEAETRAVARRFMV